MVPVEMVVDFAALLQREHIGEIAALYDEMQALGAGRAADQALLLADRLFGSLAIEPALRHALRRRWASRRLADIAWRMLRSGGEPVEPTEVVFGTAPIHVSQLLLRPDGHYLAAEMAKLGRTIVRRLRFSGS